MADKKYCIYCGAENSVTAETCVHCEQNLLPKESLLKDFLVERVKDELKGNLQDTIYDAIKNFLLSHLYGTVMTVSIVSYAVVATGVEVLADNRKKHIIPVNQPIVKVEEIRQEEKKESISITTDEKKVTDVVISYVECFADYNHNVAKIKSMEASSLYDKNLNLSSTSLGNIQGNVQVACETPKINSASPVGKLANDLSKGNTNYAQVLVDIADNSGVRVGYYLFTLVKDVGDWYIVETMNAQAMSFEATVQAARDKVAMYQQNGKMSDYETYTNAEYREFISHRLPSSYGLPTSYEFSLDRFLPHASGCLSIDLVSSGMSPSNPRSSIGSTLRSRNIKFVEFELSEDNYGDEGYMGTQSWLIVVGYFDSIWYVVEDKYLGVTVKEGL